MKWQEKQKTALEGVLYVESVVNEHGSIFRHVHQENDVGVDGHIELVRSEAATGKLVGVQVKSGDSYLADNGHEFCVSVDQAHLDYWCSYAIPVILVCYSPSKRIAAWIPIPEYVEHEAYHGRQMPFSPIRVPFYRAFDVKAMSEGVAGLANATQNKCAIHDLRM